MKYVASVLIPSASHGIHGVRHQVPAPAFFGIDRGYWTFWTKKDSNDTELCIGVRAILEFESGDLIEAEDCALNVAEQLGQLLWLVSGSAAESPRIEKLACVGPSDGVLEQWNYYYFDDRPPSVELPIASYIVLAERLPLVDETRRSRVTLGIRWYGIAIASENDMDAYLALWIGLEALGASLNDRYHVHGEKAPCTLCQNVAGKHRDAKWAGLEHLIRRMAPELLDDRTFYDLLGIRNAIAHGLRPVAELLPSAREITPDLFLLLGTAILSVLAKPDETETTLTAALPRDSRFHPGARAWLHVNGELVEHKPFFGSWAELEYTVLGSTSHIDHDSGAYIWEMQPALRWAFDQKGSRTTPTSDLSYFDRRGLKMDDATPTADLPEGIRNVPVVEWRPKILTAAWKRAEGTRHNEKAGGH